MKKFEEIKKNDYLLYDEKGVIIKEIKKLDNLEEKINHIAISPDGKMLASASGKFIKIWLIE